VGVFTISHLFDVYTQLSVENRRSLTKLTTTVLQQPVTMVTVDGVCTSSGFSWTTRAHQDTTSTASTRLRVWPRDAGLDPGWFAGVCVHHYEVSMRSSMEWVSEWVEFNVLLKHVLGHFGDESFQAITCTGTNNAKQTRENTPRTQKIILSTISI